MDAAEFQQMEAELTTWLDYGMGEHQPEDITGKSQLAAYRAAIERRTRIKCAEEILIYRDDGEAVHAMAEYSDGLTSAADLIHPDKE